MICSLRNAEMFLADDREIATLNLKLDLSGRVAIVTGGAAGIGRAIALLLARHGKAGLCPTGPFRGWLPSTP
jgi:hypothetical protein